MKGSSRCHRHAVIAFGLLLTGCASLFSSKEAEDEDASAVATDMQVKAALVKDLGNNAAAIRVESADGHVRLSGFADNEALRQQAAEAAQKVPGVGTVTNDIQIR